MAGLIRQVILKIAERCNLNCSYCYMYQHADQSYLDRPKFMSDEVYDATLRAIAEYCDSRHVDQIWLSFHGGEPTLVGPNHFNRMAHIAEMVLRERLGGMLLQTNATLLDDEWVRVFRLHRVRVGVSLDGPREIHDRTRLDFANRGSYEATIRGLAMLQDGGISHSVLCVVNPECSGLDTYRHFRSLGITRMTFLIPDATHDSRPILYGHLDGTPVADYLIPIFDAWMAENNPEVEIRFFDGIIRRLLGHGADTDDFSTSPLSYVVVESDGTIEANDALKITAHGLPNSGLNVQRNRFDELYAGDTIVSQLIRNGSRLCRRCLECPERDVCAGGYLPHRYSSINGFDNPSVWCLDLLKLINHVRETLLQEGLQLFQIAPAPDWLETYRDVPTTL